MGLIRSQDWDVAFSDGLGGVEGPPSPPVVGIRVAPEVEEEFRAAAEVLQDLRAAPGVEEEFRAAAEVEVPPAEPFIPYLNPPYPASKGRKSCTSGSCLIAGAKPQTGLTRP